MSAATIPGLRDALAAERAAEQHLAALTDKLTAARAAVAAAQDERATMVQQLAVGECG